VAWKKVVQQVLSLSGAAEAVQALKMEVCCPPRAAQLGE
jgi:hypothetical protein